LSFILKISLLKSHHWDFIINLPKQKCKDLACLLNKRRETAVAIPGQPTFRKRQQMFYWSNYISYNNIEPLTIHLVACAEKYEELDPEIDEIKTIHVEHTWISSIALNINNVQELLNHGARKLALIDSINTEKNRGYHYKHAFSENWNALQGFHYLMRLGHAINELSEFTKTLKRYIKNLGCSATLKLIKDTLFNPWLPSTWYEQQRNNTPRLELQLE